MGIPEGFKKRLKSRKLRLATKIIAALFVVTVLTGFFVVPPVIKPIIVKKITEALKREVAIGKISINPLTLSVTIRDFVLKEPGSQDRFVSFDRLYVNLQAMSIVRRGVIISSVRLENPYINVVRNKDESYNFADLIKPDPAKPQDDKDKKPVRFSLNNIELIGGSIDFSDGPRDARHEIRDMKIQIPFVSNLPYYEQIYVQPAFEAKVNGRQFAMQGQSKPFTESRETLFNVNITELDIPYYLNYAPFPLNYTVESALLDTKLVVSFTEHKNKPPQILVKGDIDLKKLSILDRKKLSLIRIPRIGVTIADSEPAAGKVNLAKLVVESPELNVVLDREGKVNLMALVPGAADKKNAGKKAELKKKPESEFLLETGELGIRNGVVNLTDLQAGRNFKTSLKNIEVKVLNFSTVKDRKATAELGLTTESGETVRVKSEFLVNPVKAEGLAELGKIALKKYAPYYRKSIAFDVRDGYLDFSTRFTVAQTEKAFDVNLDQLKTALTSLQVRKDGEKDDFARIGNFSIGNTSVDLQKQEVVLGEIGLRESSLLVRRYEDGSLNLLTLMQKPEAQAEAPQGGEKPVDATGETAQPKAGQQPKPWTVKISRAMTEKFSVKVEDRATADPVAVLIDRITVKAENISTEKNSKGTVSLLCTINRKGSLSVAGALGVDPVSADMRVSLKTVEIAPFQGYFSDKVGMFVTDGKLNAGGRVAVASLKDKGVNIRFRGDTSVASFASVDKVHTDDFVKWGVFSVTGIDASTNPLTVAIKEVALKELFSRVIVNTNGKLNIIEILAAEAKRSVEEKKEAEKAAPDRETAQKQITAAAAAPAAQPVAAQKTIKVGSVSIENGTINFIDRKVKPVYSSTVKALNAKVTNLSSEESAFADVLMTGNIDDSAPFEATGRINPLKDDLFVDLAFDFKGMDLSSASPYGGTYMGYVIEKGKLSLNLKYLIEKRKLDAQNKVFIDQFTLGDKVDSPTATKLPVKLALALLKDRKGEINLDLPITGNLDDPSFSLGRIILKVLLNILEKAATSPFSLLGALFGGQELSYVEFEKGSSALNQEGLKRIDALAKALYDRPALKLEIEGNVDLEKDLEGMKKAIITHKMKAFKLKELIRQGAPVASVDDVKIEQAEYDRFLKMVYSGESMPKPRNIIGIAKDIPPAEMERLLMTHMPVKDEELRQLASDRAQKVRDQILKAGTVDQGRVFLVAPKVVKAGSKDPGNRVAFLLK